MKPRLRRPAGMLAVVLALTTVVTAAFVGCRADYGDLAPEGSDFLDTGRTLSAFTAIQVDPRTEDSAGPQFVVAEDLNYDDLPDLVSSWKQTQPIQIHFQQRTASGAFRFETISLPDELPIVNVAGLKVADFDNDGRFDIAVLVKDAPLLDTSCLDGQATGEDADVLRGAIMVYFGPQNVEHMDRPLAWEAMSIGVSQLAGSGDGEAGPEVDGYTAMAIGDVDGDGDMDIVTAWNTDCGGNQVLVFTNLGPGQVRDGTWAVEALPNQFASEVAVKDVALADIDGDGDLDVIATRPEAEALRLHWFRNPGIDVPDDFHISDGLWQIGAVGQIDTGADIIRIGDVDRDGIADVVMRSTTGKLIQWLKGPVSPTTAPLGHIPWQVYTLAEFRDRTPEAIALGDLNFDGQLEVIASAAGGLIWLDADAAPSVFDHWVEHLIIDEGPSGQPPADISTTDLSVTPEEVAETTSINAILVVDLDGDGANDVIATFDRSGLSGLSNDALAWFRNTRRPPS